MTRETTTTAPPLPHDAAWEAVQARDRAQDGEFVYAVTTTGIYCRPSCPSRRPKRENVVFLADPDVAEQEGFRACRRCRPRAATGTPADRHVRHAVELLEEAVTAGDPEDTPDLDRLADEVGISPGHLQRTFRDRLGMTPKEYLDARRMETLKAGLRDGETVASATYGAGFGSSRSVYERAAASLGMTPGTYRRGGAGETVRWTVVDSSLGRLLVAATDQGVAAVALGDDDGTLERGLSDELPEAALERDDDRLLPWVETILRQVDGRSPGQAVPVALQGTAFQLRVWRALTEIPPGETRTYTEVAEAIDRPTAARAVARACATNRVAVVVPCHRVVRQDGSLSGYRWGVERKRELLERERRASDGAAETG